jgi:hypothetical protein
MSTFQSPSPLPPEAKRTKKSFLPQDRWVRLCLFGGAAAILLIGIGIGSGGKDEPPAAAPAPAVTVTATPAPAPTVTKVVEKTPAACVKYIELSEQGFSYAGEAMGYMSDALQAAGSFNVAALTAASDKIATVTPKMNALSTPTNAAKAECRAAAK